MEIYTTFDASNLLHALDRLRDRFGVGVDKAVEVQMGLVLVRVQKWTPPHRGKGGNTLKDRAVGREAVRRDVNRVFLSPSAVYNAAMKEKGREMANAIYKAMKEGNLPAAEALIRQVPSLAGCLISTAPDRATHDAARNSNGKVPRQNVAKHIVTSDTQLKRYIGIRGEQVGAAKKGWERGLAGTGRNGTAWTRRTQGTSGEYQAPDIMHDKPARATNDARSIGSMEERLTQTSLNAQARALNNQINAALKNSLKREGLINQYG